MPDDLVTVATFRSTVEAQLSRTKLDAHGIRTFVSDELLSTIDPHCFGGVRLQVPQADAEQATELLNEPAHPEEEENEDDAAEDGPCCPNCGKRYAYPDWTAQEWLFGACLLGVPFLLMKKRHWCCGQCHHHWAAAPEAAQKRHPYREPRATARRRPNG